LFILEVEIDIRNIVVIGSGNVAWHMVRAFGKKGIRILQVLGKNEATARKLSKTFYVPYIKDPALLVKTADLYILAVQDDKIREVALSLGLKDQFLVHTSGFSPIQVLEGASKNTGVIWPLQTLTAGKATNSSKIPFLIEANSSENTAALSRFASLVSKKVMVADSATRKEVHLAAVMASNFSNRLYTITAELLRSKNLPFDLLAPLILETARKAGKSDPSGNQTGPAARNDVKVIKQHLELLENDPETAEIYRLLSENIIKHYHGKTD
jgi:predicted short-subunit dehydrogenase-like oxidoreductase (DUF2520 family)